MRAILALKFSGDDATFYTECDTNFPSQLATFAKQKLNDFNIMIEFLEGGRRIFDGETFEFPFAGDDFWTDFYGTFDQTLEIFRTSEQYYDAEMIIIFDSDLMILRIFRKYQDSTGEFQLKETKK